VCPTQIGCVGVALRIGGRKRYLQFLTVARYLDRRISSRGESLAARCLIFH